MAQKRMFSKDIIDSDKFYELPFNSQLLYFHLGLNADVKGFIQPMKIIRLVGLKQADLMPLINGNFVIPFPSGVVVVTHWKINNQLRENRESETVFLEELKQLDTNGRIYGVLPSYSGSYPGVTIGNENKEVVQELDFNQLQDYSGSTPAQVRLDEVRLDEVRLDEVRIITDELPLSEKKRTKSLERKEISKQVLDESWQKSFIEKKYPFVESVDLYPEFEKMSEWIANPKHKMILNLESFARNWIDKIVSKLPPHEQTLKADFKVLLYDEKLNQTYKQNLETVRNWLNQGIIIYNTYRKLYTKTGIKL